MRQWIEPAVPFRPDEKELLRRLHTTDRQDAVYRRARQLLATARPQIQAAFLFREYPVDACNESGPVIGGRQLHSPLLADKIAGCDSVFLYLATCGAALGEQIDATADALDQYLLTQFACMACEQAFARLQSFLRDGAGLRRQLALDPGSLSDWPIEDLREIFALLDGLYQQTGCYLTPDGLIWPLQSVCGLLCEREAAAHRCALCPRQDCPERRVPFDAALYAQELAAKPPETE